MSDSVAARFRPTALVTGASAGLGEQYARQLAQSGYDVVLVARSQPRLEALAETVRNEFGVHAEVLTADLLTEEGIETVQERVTDRQRPIAVLVNNAGFGIDGDFLDHDVDVELDLLHLLVEVPLRLSRAALEVMVERGSGNIINISSVAGFIPRGTYGAAKSYLTSFSRWAGMNYGGRGVTVTAVCPGFVRTEFHERMGVDSGGVPDWAWLDSKRVVAESLRDAFAGKTLSIPSKRYKAGVAIATIVPTGVLQQIGRLGRSK